MQEQLREHGGDLWISGAEDYARHARDLLQDFADVISERDEDPAAAAAHQVPVPTSGARPQRSHPREASCRRNLALRRRSQCCSCRIYMIGLPQSPQYVVHQQSSVAAGACNLSATVPLCSVSGST